MKKELIEAIEAIYTFFVIGLAMAALGLGFYLPIVLFAKYLFS